MSVDAQVLIVGGGAMGVSLMYHLVKQGWSDVILTEKNDLTHGSTWHAAGLCTHFAHNPTIQELRATSIRLYRDALPAETGETCGFHACGAMRITSSQDRMDEFAHVAGLSKFTGYELQMLTRHDVERLHPLAVTDGLLGGIYEPDDGHVDPALATSAMANVARRKGASILRNNPVTAVRQECGHWIATAAKGAIRTRHLVNAAGTWGWEVGRMMGLNIPSVPMLHQYLVTDTVPAVADRVAAGLPELPMIREPDNSWYVRQERDGMLLGCYERDAQPWSVDGCPPEFGAELLPSDLDQVEYNIMAAMERMPALETGGVKSVVNGPITFTPDGNPLIGPAHGLRDAWLLTGSSMGVMEGGGAGWFLAHWMTHGAPPLDALAVDSRRFGNWADRNFRLQKAVECFGMQFGVHYPHEERPAGRGKRVSPVHDRLIERCAVMGAVHGWERPNWFGSNPGEEATPSFRRSNWYLAVDRECKTMTNAVGLVDLSAFTKFDVTGPDTRPFLNWLGTNAAPKAGRISLTHALTPAGGTESEFVVTMLAENHAYLTSAAAAQEIDRDLLHSRSYGLDVTIEDVTEKIGVLGLMGPNSRNVLASLTDVDLGAGFPWLSAQKIEIDGRRVRALRVSYIGELGWELHVKTDNMPALFDAIYAAGQGYGIGLFGAYAMNSIRLEKGYRAWGVDLTTERTPAESGIGFTIRPDGRSFMGKDALNDRMASKGRWEMVLLSVESEEFDPFNGHCVHHDGAPVGIVTSAAWGHRTRQALALAYLWVRGLRYGLTVEVLGRMHPATVLERPPFDPENTRMKS